MVRHTDIERHNGGSGKQRQLFASPVVIAVDAVFIIPEVTVYRIATGTGLLAEQCFCLFLTFQRRDVGDGALQFKQEGIQIDGDELGGTNARQTTSITEPTGRVIPTGGRPARKSRYTSLGGRPECFAVSTSLPIRHAACRDRPSNG